MTIATLTPAEAQAQIAQGARLIDIRANISPMPSWCRSPL